LDEEVGDDEVEVDDVLSARGTSLCTITGVGNGSRSPDGAASTPANNKAINVKRDRGEVILVVTVDKGASVIATTAPAGRARRGGCLEGRFQERQRGNKGGKGE